MLIEVLVPVPEGPEWASRGVGPTGRGAPAVRDTAAVVAVAVEAAVVVEVVVVAAVVAESVVRVVTVAADVVVV